MEERNDQPDPIIARIEREAGIPNLLNVLTERLEPTDLQSLLLKVQQVAAKRVTPERLLQRFRDDRFVRPSATNPVAMAAFEQLAFASLPDGYTPLALSPLCPLGTCAAVATVDQNKVVATIRNSEVISDPTNVLALESALRRRDALRKNQKSPRVVKLLSSNRVVRAQYINAPGLFAHFHLLALTAAGRDTGGFAFELQTLREQFDYFLRLIAAVSQAHGRELKARIAVTDLGNGAITTAVKAELFEELGKRHPQAELGFDPERTSGRGYYQTVCFKLHCQCDGKSSEIGDGGVTDWTQKLLSDRKERFLIGCVAPERILQFVN